MDFKPNSDIIRSQYVWWKLKQEIEIKWLTISFVAEKMKTAQPLLSRSLNGKVVSSDKLFTRIGEAIWLSSVQIKKIFREADEEEYKYKYGKDIMPELGDFSVMDEDDLEDVLLSKNGIKLSSEAKKDIKMYVEFMKSKYSDK